MFFNQREYPVVVWFFYHVSVVPPQYVQEVGNFTSTSSLKIPATLQLQW
jgi:hypothetical protein